MSRSLIVLPDDTGQPILDAVAAAKKSLRIKMFIFSDPALLAAVIAAHQRGVKVQVMLNPARRSGEAENEETRKKLEHAGVEVMDSNPAFDVTHEKSMVVDDEIAFVQSLKVHKLKGLKLHAKMMLADGKRSVIGSINLAPGSFDSRRELAIEVDDEHLAKRLQHLVDHDWGHSHPLDLSDEGLLADLEDRGERGSRDPGARHDG